jgi:hypothetical protein
VTADTAFYTAEMIVRGNLMTPSLRSQTLQSSAALRTGTRIEKINSKHGDSQTDGAHGVINTSLGPKMWHGQVTHGYLVVWDDCKAPAFVVGDRIRKLTKE